MTWSTGTHTHALYVYAHGDTHTDKHQGTMHLFVSCVRACREGIGEIHCACVCACVCVCVCVCVQLVAHVNARHTASPAPTQHDDDALFGSHTPTEAQYEDTEDLLHGLGNAYTLESSTPPPQDIFVDMQTDTAPHTETAPTDAPGTPPETDH